MLLSDEVLLSKAKKLIETKVCWGNSMDWTNQDFIALSKKIQQDTTASLSHITLKRLWGKVKYDGLPQIYTLNTLVQFLGYEGWRDFKVKNSLEEAIPQPPVEVAPILKGRKKLLKRLLFPVILILLSAAFIVFIPASKKKKLNPRDFSFSSREILKAGIPNSVVFDYDATRSPSDSVIIQQSWDTKLQAKVSKDQHQHTLIYYYPGFFKSKLLVDGQVVKEHDLLIKSDGWVTVLAASPVPVYFKEQHVLTKGKMYLPIEKINAQNVSLTPQAPLLSYCNVQNFGEIYSDNFVFETSLRNEYREGSSICQMTNIYLLCEGTAVGIPLCAKGCESAINFFFTGFNVSGKQNDLSAFGVDFSSFVKVKVESANGKAAIFLNGKLAYQVDHDISKSKIIGIDLVFQGTGSVDYVKLSNREVLFEDEF